MKWTKVEREIVAGALYAAKASLPASDGWSEHVDKNALGFAMARVRDLAERHEEWERSARELLIPAAQERLAKASSVYHRQSANENLEWHEKGAKKHGQDACRYRRIHAKLEAFGLPPEEKEQS